jgi:hypothetical protein
MLPKAVLPKKAGLIFKMELISAGQVNRLAKSAVTRLQDSRPDI